MQLALPRTPAPGSRLGLCDLTGRLLARYPLPPTGPATVPTTGLAPGTYLLQLLGPAGNVLANQRLLLE